MSDSTPIDPNLRTRGRWALALTLAVLAVALVSAGFANNGNGNDPVSVASPRPTAPAATEGPAPTTAASTPTSVTIPSIAVTSELVGLGIKKDRTVEVPQDPDQAGWYEPGTVPGQPGSAVILGHVDSLEGPAIFDRLDELAPGEQIHIAMEDGTVETFMVTRSETIRNADFPAQKIYAGTPKRPTLSLVTCGGDYDSSRGGYQSNVVVYTEHVGTTWEQ